MSSDVLHIVVPTKNRSELICDLLGILSLCSNLDGVTVCVVDDNSGQEEKEKLKAYQVEYANINFVYLDCSYGAPYARNLGSSFSGSDWVWFVDDDDTPDFDTVVVLLSRLRSEKIEGCGVHFLCSRVFSKDGLKREVTPVGKGLFERMSRHGPQVNTSCVIFSRKMLELVGGWDEALVSGQDTDLLLRLSTYGDALVHEDLSVRINHHESARITGNPKRQMVGKMQFVRKNWKLLHWSRSLRYLASIVTFYPYVRRWLA